MTRSGHFLFGFFLNEYSKFLLTSFNILGSSVSVGSTALFIILQKYQFCDNTGY